MSVDNTNVYVADNDQYKRKLASIQVISEIFPIPGADSIEGAKVLGWQVVVAKKDGFKVGDKVIYLEIDSVCPARPWSQFLEKCKYRIKTVRLRKQLSQGLVLPLSVLNSPPNHERSLIKDPRGDSNYNNDFDEATLLEKENMKVKILKNIGLTDEEISFPLTMTPFHYDDFYDMIFIRNNSELPMNIIVDEDQREYLPPNDIENFKPSKKAIYHTMQYTDSDYNGGFINNVFAGKVCNVPEIKYEVGDDVTDILEVTKYESQSEKIFNMMNGGLKALSFPSYLGFIKTDEPRIQSNQDKLELFKGHQWYATVKYDGTSSTYFIDPENPTELAVCSRNYKLKLPSTLESLSGNAYWSVGLKYHLYEVLQKFPHLVLQGEVYGPSIQSNKLNVPDLRLAIFSMYDLTLKRYCNLPELLEHIDNFEKISKTLSSPLDEVLQYYYKEDAVSNEPTSIEEKLEEKLEKENKNKLHYDKLNTIHSMNSIVKMVEIDSQGDSFGIMNVSELLEKAKGKYRGSKRDREGLVFRLANDVEVDGSRASFKVINNDFLEKEE